MARFPDPIDAATVNPLVGNFFGGRGGSGDRAHLNVKQSSPKCPYSLDLQYTFSTGHFKHLACF